MLRQKLHQPFTQSTYIFLYVAKTPPTIAACARVYKLHMTVYVSKISARDLRRAMQSNRSFTDYIIEVVMIYRAYREEDSQ